MTAIEHSMLNGEMVTETVDFYPDTTKPVRAVLDCTTARRQYCPQTSVTDNVVYVSDNGSIAAGVYTLTITCTDTQGKKRRYKSDPCIEVYDATSAAEIAATFDSETYELNGVFYTFAGGGTVQADWDETDPDNPSYIQNKPDLSEYATDEELQAVEESIPDVPAWALQPQKPAYTAGEVGAVPTTRTVNGKALSQDITLNAEDVGAYQKPSTGIPKSDMAAGVQSSLEKADTALQRSDLTPIENDIDAIEEKIPSSASASNQLADKTAVDAALATKANTTDVYTKTETDTMLEGMVICTDDDGSASTASFDAQADTVWHKAQTLSSAQQAQARSNIGAQEALVSGTNIKTINNESILGSGNITISGGGGGSGEANVIESISVNGTAQAVTNKNVNLTVPTSSTVTAIVTLTEAQYTALATKDGSTLYIITA